MQKGDSFVHAALWELITVSFGLENVCQRSFIKSQPAAAAPGHAVIGGTLQCGQVEYQV